MQKLGGKMHLGRRKILENIKEKKSKLDYNPVIVQYL